MCKCEDDKCKCRTVPHPDPFTRMVVDPSVKLKGVDVEMLDKSKGIMDNRVLLWDIPTSRKG